MAIRKSKRPLAASFVLTFAALPAACYIGAPSPSTPATVANHGDGGSPALPSGVPTAPPTGTAIDGTPDAGAGPAMDDSGATASVGGDAGPPQGAVMMRDSSGKCEIVYPPCGRGCSPLVPRPVACPADLPPMPALGKVVFNDDHTCNWVADRAASCPTPSSCNPPSPHVTCPKL